MTDKQHKYYENNKEQINKRNNLYHQLNRETILKRQKRNRLQKKQAKGEK